jgi:hypothetical protein
MLGFYSRREQDFFFPYSVQTSSGAHLASYPMGTMGCFPQGKAVGAEADHSPPSSAKTKNGRVIPPLPRIFLRRGAEIIKNKDKLPLLYLYVVR